MEKYSVFLSDDDGSYQEEIRVDAISSKEAVEKVKVIYELGLVSVNHWITLKERIDNEGNQAIEG